MTIKFKRLHKDAIVPSYAYTGDSGFDFVAIKDTMIPGNTRAKIDVGLSVKIPQGYELQIRPRSGTSLKTDITVMFGTVDSGYTGPLGIIAHNTSKHFLYVKKGDRIAQGVIAPVMHVLIEETDDVGTSERGESGFGSTNES